MSGSLDYPVALECMSGNWLLVLCRHFQHIEQQTVMYKTVMEQVFALRLMQRSWVWADMAHRGWGGTQREG